MSEFKYKSWLPDVRYYDSFMPWLEDVVGVSNFEFEILPGRPLSKDVVYFRNEEDAVMCELRFGL